MTEKKEPLSYRIKFLEDTLKEELKTRREYRAILKKEPNNEAVQIMLELTSEQISSTKRLIKEALNV